MIKNLILTSALVAAATLGAAAQETLYLVKGDRVVGKYSVEDVDYATFKLPEGVIDAPIWITADAVGKNFISYTVNTTSENTMYVHSLVSDYLLDYYAMDAAGIYFDELDDTDKELLIKDLLPYTNAFVATGSKSFTFNDYTSVDGGYPVTVTPGTPFHICVLEINANTQMPLDLLVTERVSTQAPGESSATFNVTFNCQNESGLQFDFSGSDDILYVTTIYGPKALMEMCIELYGKDRTFTMFGQIYTIASLQGAENSTWPLDGSGEYLMLARAYDIKGDMKEVSVTAVGDAQTGIGPEISITSRDKSTGHVSLGFEISPSNVEEAYVRMLGMNDTDDRLNAGYELHELAMGGDAIDITNDINTKGEYTFTSDDVDDTWHSIIIYAKNSDGRTTLRTDFITLDGAEWYEYNPVHAPKKAPAFKVGMNPTIKK